MDRPLFYSKTRLACTSIFESERTSLLADLRDKLGISRDQITEAASYSMAMVVRFALGLSAHEGEVCVLASDSIAGCVGLSTLRHLVNAGATGHVFALGTIASKELQREIKTLEVMGVPIKDCSSVDGIPEMVAQCASCHNVIYGLYCGPESTPLPTEFVSALNDSLNELSTPIHCIELPLGLHPDNGTQNGAALFASSTLSLGAPLAGLHAGHELAGRHYVCDISITREMYSQLDQPAGPALFSEQPVVQILFELPEEPATAA